MHSTERLSIFPQHNAAEKNHATMWEKGGGGGGTLKPQEWRKRLAWHVGPANIASSFATSELIHSINNEENVSSEQDFL